MKRQPIQVEDRRAALDDLAERFGLHLIYAFGSRAREALAWLDDPATALDPGGSDLDVGVLAAGSLDIDAKVDIAQTLEDLTGIARVDVVDLATADPFLAANIIRGERLYAQDSRAGDEYDLYVLRRAGDLAPLERERIALVLRTRS